MANPCMSFLEIWKIAPSPHSVHIMENFWIQNSIKF